MAEAGLDVDIHPAGCGLYQEEESHAGLISGRLRKRKANSETAGLPEGYVPLSRFCAAVVELDFPIAKVKSGRFVVGRVVGLPEESRNDSEEADQCETENTEKEQKWRVCFDDKQVEYTSLNLGDLR
jgi:hypothetical protein